MENQYKSAAQRPPLPIGVDSFAEICEDGFYYVDKTLLIKALVDSKARRLLFTRPRRFGKTLNMDMLRTFFEISEEDTSQYFRDKEIWAYGPSYTELQGHYPVISLSLLGVEAKTWDGMLQGITELLQNEFDRQCQQLTLESLRDRSRKQLERFIDGDPNEIDVQRSLVNLTRILHEAHGVKPILLIDEYDAPIQRAWTKKYYDDAVDFMRALLTPALKSNQHLSFACLTGVLRVASGSMFSGLNNLEVDGVLSELYDEFFGFTEAEVRAMAAVYGASNKMDEIRDWYEGYRFGKQEVFNPWSVLNYFRFGCQPETYWANTSGNVEIGHFLEKRGTRMKDAFVSLLSGRPIWSQVNKGLKYPDIDAAEEANPKTAAFTLLLMSGYLTPTGGERKAGTDNEDTEIELKIPNREVNKVFRNAVLEKFAASDEGENLAVMLGDALEDGNAVRVEKALRDILTRASFHDLTSEQSYHNLLLGITVGISRSIVFSNRKAGDGRYDLCLEPRDHAMPGTIMEFKYEKGLSEDALAKLADTALAQIWSKDYTADLRPRDVHDVNAFGIAFSGKHVKVVAEKRSL